MKIGVNDLRYVRLILAYLYDLIMQFYQKLFQCEITLCFLQGYLGALYGTYIHIRVPSEYTPRYMTRKGYISTNVLKVCERNLILLLLAGWEGSVDDGHVL